jgi:predicted dehydrogenase
MIEKTMNESKTNNSPVLRYGLIGAGAMASGHIHVIEMIQGARIAAYADPNAQSRNATAELLKEKTIPAYTDHCRMLEEVDLDAVVIATPNDTHADLACDALESGVHVLLEKPLASTVEGCMRIVKAARQARGICQIGLELRYDAIWKRTRDIIHQGKIGRVRQLWCKEFRGPWGHKVGNWIIKQNHSGGAFVEKDCHHFDLFNWYAAARPVEVAAFGTRDLVHGQDYFGEMPTVLDNAQTIIRYENDVVANLMLCMYCDGYQEGLEIGVIGTEGWLVANSGRENVLRVSSRDGNETVRHEFTTPENIAGTSHNGAVYFEHLAFRENILDNRVPMTDVEVGLWGTAVGLAAERAAAEKRVILLHEILEESKTSTLEPQSTEVG